jgi:hypothetical protein
MFPPSSLLSLLPTFDISTAQEVSNIILELSFPNFSIRLSVPLALKGSLSYFLWVLRNDKIILDTVILLIFKFSMPGNSLVF